MYIVRSLDPAILGSQTKGEEYVCSLPTHALRRCCGVPHSDPPVQTACQRSPRSHALGTDSPKCWGCSPNHTELQCTDVSIHHI